MPNSEAWPLGRHHALYCAANGAVALGNETASVLWQKLAEGLDAGALGRWAGRTWGLDLAEAQRLVDGLVEVWRGGGLLEMGTPLPQLQAVPTYRSRDEVFQRYFKTSFGTFRLVSDDAYADAVMASVLSPCASDEREEGGVVEIGLHRAGDDYWVSRDGVALSEPDNISFARHEVLSQLVQNPTQRQRTSAILHAAAVSIGGRAVVIAGTCGRGKSTLTACLVHAGAGYLGDDLIPLERNGRWICGFPVSLSVKPGAWELVERLHPRKRWSDVVPINDHRIKYVDLSSRRPPAMRASVGAIVFPHYQAGAAFSAERVAPEQALLLLLEAGARTVGPSPTLEGLCSLADRTPAFKLTYGNWRYAERFIAAEIARSP